MKPTTEKHDRVTASSTARDERPAAVNVGRAFSADEFSPLRQVIVGDPTLARIPALQDPSAWLNLYGDLLWKDAEGIPAGAFPQRVIEETAEDLAVLVDTLEDLGVIVHRPQPVDHTAEFGTPEWSSTGFYSYCPRDLTLVVGDLLIETPSPMRARYFELFGLKHLFNQYMANGSPWISAPKLRLADDLFRVDPDGRPRLREAEPVFDAANVLRCGRDLFYLVSCSGNELGRVWLENTLCAYGDFRIHPLRNVYHYAHLDSTICLLRPGLVLLNPERITEENLPKCLTRWDKIWCPPMTTGTPDSEYPLSSKWIGMNLLMINPELAILDGEQTALIKELERAGISVLSHRLRHARAMGGGFHCVTLDTVRDGQMEDYFA